LDFELSVNPIKRAWHTCCRHAYEFISKNIKPDNLFDLRDEAYKLAKEWFEQKKQDFVFSEMWT
jgi:hypothetical protein